MSSAYQHRGSRGGGYKKGATTKKRSSPDDDDTAPRSFKKARDVENDDKEEQSGAAFVPKLLKDQNGDGYVNLKENGTRRVTVNEFKGNVLVNIREYYHDTTGALKPTKRGISLPLDQYNAFLTAIPLLETTLNNKMKGSVARPDYTTLSNAAEPSGEAEGNASGEDEDEVSGEGED